MPLGLEIMGKDQKAPKLFGGQERENKQKTTMTLLQYSRTNQGIA